MRYAFIAAAGLLLVIAAFSLYQAFGTGDNDPRTTGEEEAVGERLDALEAEVVELRATQQLCAEAIVQLMIDLANAVSGDYNEAVTERLTDDYIEACR